MRIVFLSYNYSADIKSREEWIDRIKFYVGWVERLTRTNTVIRVEQINYEGNFVHNGVQYYCMNNGTGKNYFPRKLNRFVKNLEPDVVIISSFLFPLQVIQLRYTLGRKVKLIVQHHAEKPFGGIKKWLQHFASLQLNACVFSANEIAAEWISKNNLHTSIKCLEVTEVSSVFFPSDKSMAKARTNVVGDTIFFWVGRLNDNKDPLTAVKAFIKFCTIEPRVSLYMIYQTTELLEEIQELIIQSGTADRIILIGKIKHDDLLYWYNSADFFLSASHYEGSGTALCEAMSCGCIPVVTSIPSFRMISGGCGLLYDPGNEASLLSALRHSVELNRKETRIKVLSHFEKELSFEAIASKFEVLLNSL